MKESTTDLKSLRQLALEAWVQNVTSLLCYQPDVPMEHKLELVTALNTYIQRCAEYSAATRL